MSTHEHTRAIAEALVQRLRNDPVFRQQVESDPVGILVQAGVPERVIPDCLREANLTADVVGFDAGGCVDTCYATVGDRGLPG